VRATSALQPLLDLVLKGLHWVVTTLDSYLCFLKLIEEVLEVLSCILLFTGLELFVTFTEKAFKQLRADSLLVELVFLLLLFCRGIVMRFSQHLL